MKKFTGNFLREGNVLIQILRTIGLSMVMVLLATMAFGQEAQATYHVWAEEVDDCYREDNTYEVVISTKDFEKIDSFALYLKYNATKFDADLGSFDVLSAVEDEIGTASISEPSSGVLKIIWDVANEPGSDPFKTILPVESMHDIFSIEFSVLGFIHNYATPSVPFEFDTELEWLPTTQFWNDEGQKSPILDSEITGNGHIYVTQAWDEGIDVELTTVNCWWADDEATVTSPVADMYSFNNGTTWQASPLGLVEKGTTNLILVKSNGCISYVDNFEVDDAQPLTWSVRATAQECEGGNGDIEIYNIKGGIPDYVYWVVPDGTAWDDFKVLYAANPENPTLIANYRKTHYVIEKTPGTYHIAVNDAADCRGLDMYDFDGYWKTVTIDPADPWDVDKYVSNEITCNDFGNGEITVVVDGATPYGDGTYWISFNGAAEVRSDSMVVDSLYAGTYTVNIRDSVGCTYYTTVKLSNPEQIMFAVGHTDASCQQDIGTLWIEPGSITPEEGNYVKWVYSTYPDFSANNDTIYDVMDTATGLPAGVYYIRVFNDDGCFADYENVQDDNAVKLLDIEYDLTYDPIICHDGSTTVTVEITSGESGHDFIFGWDTDADTTGAEWNSSGVFSPVYGYESNYFFIYDRTIDCVLTLPTPIDNPDPLNISIMWNLTLAPTCPGNSDGAVTVWGWGGEPFQDGSYLFKFDDRPWDQVSGNVTFSADDQPHMIVVKDALGCMDSTYIELEVRENIVWFQDTIYTNCVGDQIDLFANIELGEDEWYAPWLQEEDDYLERFWWYGYSLPWEIDWDGLPNLDTDPGDQWEAWWYWYQQWFIWDAVDGWDTVQVQGNQYVREVTLYYSTVSTTTQDIIAEGNVLYDGVHNELLSAGIYYVVAQDEWGCTSTPETIVIIDPEPLMVEITSTDALCWPFYGGTVTVEAFNGLYDWPDIYNPTDYRYQWMWVQQPEIFSHPEWWNQVTWLPLTDGSLTNDSVGSLDLRKGSYWFAVREACSLSNPDLIWISDEIVIDGYDQILVDEYMVDIVDVTCNVYDVDEEECVASDDGSVEIPEGAVIGGLAPYTFKLYLAELDDFEIKSATVGDDLLATLSDTTAASFSDLEAGYYYIVVSDAAGCPEDTVDFYIDQPDCLELELDHVNPSCYGEHDGILIYSVTGGDGTYWETTNNVGEYENIGDIPPSRWFEITEFEDTVEGWYIYDRLVEAGIYEVYIKDGNGCITGPYLDTVVQPDMLAIAIEEVINPTCTEDEETDPLDNGSISVEVSGGWDDYGFDYEVLLWNGNHSYLPDDIDGYIYTWEGLESSNYTVTVAESNSSLPDNPYFTYLNYMDSLVNEDFPMPYQNGDAACLASIDISLVDNPITYDDIEYFDVLCYNDTTGQIHVHNVQGGTPPYRFMLQGPLDYIHNDEWNWADSQTPHEYVWDNLPSGHYTIHIGDDLGCTIYRESGHIHNPDSLEIVSVELIDHALCNGENGTIEVVAQGGTPDYLYAVLEASVIGDNIFPIQMLDEVWQESPVFNVPAGVWIGYVKDANGCLQGGPSDSEGTPILQHRVHVLEPDEVEAERISSEDALCYGAANGKINVGSIFGGNGADFAAVVTGTDYTGTEITPKYFTELDGTNDVLGGLMASTDKAHGDKLDAGDKYTIVFIDSEGCESDPYTVAVYQPEPFVVVVDVEQDAFICPDDLAGVFEIRVVSGGTPFSGDDDFLYRWDSYEDADETILVESTNYGFANTFLGEAGLYYRVYAKDANGCETTAVRYIDNVDPIVFEVTDISCYADPLASAYVVASGEAGRTFKVWYRQIFGEGPAGAWTAYDGWFADDIEILEKFSYGDQDEVEGHFQFYVEDDMGCMSDIVDMTFVPVQHPLELTVSTVSEGNCTKDVELTITGGINQPEDYTVTVNGEVVDHSEIVTLTAETNLIVVTDAHLKCSDEVTVTITPVELTDEDEVEVLYGETVTYTEHGLSVVLDPSVATEYVETYTDAEGCTVTLTITVIEVAQQLAIAEVQGTEDDSPIDGEMVEVTGTVTGVVAGEGYFIQDASAVRSGIYVADAVTTPDVGDGLTVTGSVSEINSVTTITATEVVAATEIDITALVVAPDAAEAEDYESVLVQVDQVHAMAGTTAGEWNITTETDAAVASDNLLALGITLVDENWYDIAGIVNGTDDTYAIEMTELVTTSIIDPLSINFDVYPNPFNDRLYIDNAQELTRVVITNIAGQRVLDIVNPEREVRTPDLVDGVYVVTLFTEDGIAKTQKIVKR